MSTSLTRIILVLLTVAAMATVGQAIPADGQQLEIVTSCTTIAVGVRTPWLWEYRARDPQCHQAVATPTLNLDGRDVTLRLADAKPVGQPQVLANGCREYVFTGSVENEPGLQLKLTFRLADDDPVVRFRYEFSSDRPRRLTKAAGTDKLGYLGLSLAGMRDIAELRLSEFNELYHSYMPVERAIEERHFNAGETVMGPILLAGDSTHQLLLAYEHGSTAPDAFLRYRLAPDRSVTLEAVKGNYWAGQEIGPGRPFTTIWLEMAALRGDRQALERVYRDFVLRRLAASPATRQPWVFYNTWNYQERIKAWQGKPYLSEMNLDRMLREIDVAHRMGIEVFVIDTGWYEKTGDWSPNRQRFPDGLKEVKARLDRYGMRLGLWFAPTTVALSSQMLKTHEDCVMTQGGKRPKPWSVWETENSIGCCVVSRYGQDFADELIRLHKELGVSYFKWDAISQYGCDDPGHGHGTAANSAAERGECYAFQMPLALAGIAQRVSDAAPGTICDFDMTESGRCFGLAFLASGKYFLINNGPYYQNYDHPLPPDGNWNLFFRPGPARTWICRTPLVFDRWIPSSLFLTHYLPDDPAENQMLCLGSMVLGQNGIWGDLPALSEAGVARFGKVLAQYKKVRDDITRAFPVRSGPVGGSPEVHEKIADNGRGAVVLFAGHGRYRYLTAHRVDRHVWHDPATTVTFDAEGHAVIEANLSKPGASIVFFGVDDQ